MLIISKFRDYYDCVMNMGIDKTIPYYRQTIEIPVKRSKGYSWKTEIKNATNYLDIILCLSDLDCSNYWYNGHYQEVVEKYRIDVFLIGFCGKIYPIAINEYKNAKKEKNYNFFSTYEQYDKVIIYKKDFKKKVKEFFDKDYNKSFEHLFIEHKTPIFVVRKVGKEFKIVINDCLKDINFQKIIDPFTAFQSIQQYISGVLGVDSNKMINISDADMQVKKGFTGEYSFRQPPKKRK